MTADLPLASLLERAAGPDPGLGDIADVRRRARRFTRRHRARSAVVCAALLLPAVLVVDSLRPREVPSDLVAAAPEDVLFERALPDGSTLRVSRTEVEGEIAVEWPGSPDPVVMTPRTSLGDGRPGFMVLTTRGTPYVEQTFEEIDEQGWVIVSLAACPGDPAVELRAWPFGAPEETDSMHLVDGLAVVVVPVDVSEEFGFIRVNVDYRDAAGNVLQTLSSESPPAESAAPTVDAGDAATPPGLTCDAEP
jgi:hypothetical protein